VLSQSVTFRAEGVWHLLVAMRVTPTKPNATLPKALATSVVRSAQKGNSHGGAYLIDFATGTAEKVIDWNAQDIDWSGRGFERGLRGVAFGENEVYMAAANSIFVLDRCFRRLGEIPSHYLKDCHEICISGGYLYATSTGFDSILRADLSAGAFDLGFRFEVEKEVVLKNQIPEIVTFDPRGPDGPISSDNLHINSVHACDGDIFVSGTNLPWLLRVDTTLALASGHARLPKGTHNAMPFRDGVLANNTTADRVSFFGLDGNVRLSVPVKHSGCSEPNVEKASARAGFARGLCVAWKGTLVGGTTPATVSLYDIDAQVRLQDIALESDIRNAIHGLALWPF
jgi:hypothetical protein